MNMIKAIYMMILSLGADFGYKPCLRQEKSEERAESPFDAQMRKKMHNVSTHDKTKAIELLSAHLGSGFVQILDKFEKKQDFQKITLSEDQVKALMLGMAQKLSTHSAQKATLVLLLATARASAPGARRVGSMGSYLEQFEQEGITIVPDKGSWAIKTKTGCIWPANVVEKFI